MGGGEGGEGGEGCQCVLNQNQVCIGSKDGCFRFEMYLSWLGDQSTFPHFVPDQDQQV